VQTFASTGSIFGTQRYKMEKRVDQLMGPDRPKRNTPSIQVTSDSMSTLSSSLASPQKTSLSQFLVRDDSGQRSITSIGSPSSIASVTEYADSEISDKSTESTSKTDGQPDQSRTQAQKRAEQARQASQPSFIETSSYAPGYAAQRLNGEPSDRSVQRSSTQDRPSLSEIRKDEDEPFDFSYLDFKPKVKLGPRPVAVGEKTKRPPVAGVAAVPATYRPALQKKQEPTPPQPHIPVIVPAPAPTPSVLPRPPPIPDIPEYNPRPVSRGSVKSLPSHKSTTMTPDKIRLMKAVELRKKQLRKSNPQPSTFAPRKKESVPSVPNLMRPPELRAAKQSDISFEPEIQPDHERQAPSKKPDSGIEMGYERHEKLEEGPQTSETSEESKSPLADPTTLAQLQPSPPADRQSLRLDTAGPRSVDTSADTGVGAEPTISLDMLEDPRIPMFRNPSYNDSPTLGRAAEVERLGIATPPQRSMSHVPTIAMPDGSRLLSSNGKQFETGRPDNDRRADTLKEDSGDLSRNSSNGTLDASMESHRHHDALAKRRRGIVAPLRIDPNADGNFSSDDEFLEELQSATFQQAKPISMKSPMAPSFTRKPSSQSVVSNHSGHSVRSINIRRSSSNLLEQYTYSPDQLSPGLTATPPMRSHSMITPPSERGDPMQALRRNGSTGVTKRIQALAEGSSNEISADDASRPLTPEAAAHSTWRERKSAVRSPPKPRTSSFRTLSRHSNKSSGYPTPPAVTPSAYPHPEPVWNVQHDSSSNRDSVSVTARIVRSYIDDEPAQAEGALQQSQLVINHKRASASTSRIDKALAPLNTNTNLNVSPPPKSESAPMVSSPQTEYRQLHSLNRRSFGRHRQVSPISPSAEDFPPPPTHARASYTSSNDEHAAYKEGSRTSRFFKRMSNLGGGHKRRNSGPQSMPHALDVSSRTGSVATTDRSDMPPAVVIGDLNVQFPDSLVSRPSPLPTLRTRAQS